MSGAITGPARRIRTNAPALAALGSILALALLIRLRLADRPLWFDELASLFYAHRPFALLWSGWMARETNPPLFYSILRLWTGFAGGSDRAVRLCTIAAGIGSIALAYAAIGRLYGRRAGIHAAVLLALSPQHITYSLTVRGYVFVFAAALASIFGLLLFAVRIDDARSRRRALALYAGGAICAIYCHTTMFVWPAAAMIALAALFRTRLLERALVAEILLANLLVLAAGAWWLTVTLQQVHGRNIGWIAPLGMPAAAGLFIRTDFLLEADPGSAWAPLLVVPALAAWGIVATRRSVATRLAVAAMAAAAALLWLLNLRQPILMERTVFWLSAFPLMLAAAALARMPGRWLGPASLGALSLLLLADDRVVFSQPQPEDWRAMVLRLARDRAAVLLVQDEAMSIAADTSCSLELHRDRCPFPILAFRTPGPHFDTWADGLSRRPAHGLSWYLAEPGGRHFYVYGRIFHDLLGPLHCAGVLTGVQRDPPALVGPLPARALGAVARPDGWRRCASLVGAGSDR